MRRTLAPVVAIVVIRALTMVVYLPARALGGTSQVVTVLGWIYAFSLPAIGLAFLARLINERLFAAKALHRLTHGQGRRQDADYLVRIADNIPGGRTICAFGEACSWPVQSFVAKFKDEFVAKGEADEERRATAGKNVEPASKETLTVAAHS